MRQLSFRKLVTISLFSLFLGACSSQSDEEVLAKVPDNTPQAMYKEAKQNLDNELFGRAITLLSAIDSRFPFGPISKQVQLDLIYAYYRSGKYPQAVAHIDRFMRLNPDHPDNDYVLYIRGRVNMDTGINVFQELVGIERSEKDITPVRDAFSDFQKLLKNYPDSKYQTDARQRMVYLLNLLSRHELAIADYYLRRGAYLAAANRGKYILEYYSDSASVKDALELMVVCYERLGLTDLKADAERVLKENYSKS